MKQRFLCRYGPAPPMIENRDISVENSSYGGGEVAGALGTASPIAALARFELSSPGRLAVADLLGFGPLWLVLRKRAVRSFGIFGFIARFERLPLPDEEVSLALVDPRCEREAPFGLSPELGRSEG